MAETLRELFVKLGVDAQGQEALGKWEARLDAVWNVAKAFVAWRVAERVGSELFNLGSAAAQNATRLDATASALRVTTGELQAAEYAARVASVPIEAVAGAIANLRDAQAGAATGDSGSLGILRVLGARKGQDAIDMLATFADRIKRLGPDLQRLAAKRAGLEPLLPLLRMGGDEVRRLGQEAKETGFIMSEDMVKRGVEVQRTLNRLGLQFEAIRNELLTEFLPVFEKVVRGFLEWVKANRDLLTIQNLTRLLAELERMAIRVGAAVKILTIWLTLTAVIVAAVQIYRNFALLLLVLRLNALSAGLSIRQLAVALLTAEAPLLLVAGLFAALGAGVLLAAEDYVKFSQDQKSLIGEMMQSENVFSNMVRWWGDLQEKIAGTVDKFSEFLGLTKEADQANYDKTIAGLKELNEQTKIQEFRVREGLRLGRSADVTDARSRLEDIRNRQRLLLRQQTVMLTSGVVEASTTGPAAQVVADARRNVETPLQISAPQTNTINVNGAGDPEAVAERVVKKVEERQDAKRRTAAAVTSRPLR